MGGVVEPYRSYVNVVSRLKEDGKAYKDNVVWTRIVLEENYQLHLDNASRILVAKVRQASVMPHLYKVFLNDGFTGLKTYHAGGLWVWIEFLNQDACLAFQKNSIKGFIKEAKPITKNIKIDEGMVWLEIEGLPLVAWGSTSFEKI